MEISTTVLQQSVQLNKGPAWKYPIKVDLLSMKVSNSTTQIHGSKIKSIEVNLTKLNCTAEQWIPNTNHQWKYWQQGISTYSNRNPSTRVGFNIHKERSRVSIRIGEMGPSKPFYQRVLHTQGTPSKQYWNWETNCQRATIKEEPLKKNL